MERGLNPFDRLALAAPEDRAAALDIGTDELRALVEEWQLDAHDGRRSPAGGDWRVWLMMAGRGFGKTRTGAEWVNGLARRRPELRIALVGATIGDARAVMVEGESGILACAFEGDIARWQRSEGRLTWASGAQAQLFSGASPDSLRGPQHHIAWCDEIAKWRQPDATWDNLRLGLRLGDAPSVLVTTTPRPATIMHRLVGGTKTAQTGGPTRANFWLGEEYLAAMEEAYGGTRLGRQELGGELLEDHEGALWTRALIERCRVAAAPDKLARIVIGVDPPAGAGAEADACGIVVAGVGEDGVGYVLADESAAGLSPEGWAERVAAAGERWGADLVLVEANQGGAMAESVLLAADPAMPVRPAFARKGKAARAEPVSVRFVRGAARLVGAFPELEDQLCGMLARGGYCGPGRSPDRADAMVWALTELLLKPERGQPRIRAL